MTIGNMSRKTYNDELSPMKWSFLLTEMFEKYFP